MEKYIGKIEEANKHLRLISYNAKSDLEIEEKTIAELENILELQKQYKDLTQLFQLALKAKESNTDQYLDQLNNFIEDITKTMERQARILRNALLLVEYLGNHKSYLSKLTIPFNEREIEASTKSPA